MSDKTYEQFDFKYVSLFSGIGGFEQALDKFGGNCVFASEIDKFASQAYATLYGDEVLHGDINEINAEDVPDHDLLVGGFPCQAFSVAGNRGGFEDARGTLFFDIARIANEKKPKAILAENVKGLVGHDKGRTLDTIVKTLNDIGYRVDFEVLNSKYFGVPQNRERIFIVAVRDDLIDNEPWANTKGSTVVPKGKRRISGYDDVKTFNFDWPGQGRVTIRLRDILEPEVDEKYYLSDDKTAKLVTQLNEGAGLGKDGKLGTLVNGVNISPTVDANYVKGLGPSDVEKNRNRRPMVTEPQMVGHIDIKGHDAIKRTYSTESISPTLTTMGGGHREPKIAEEQLTDTEEWAIEQRIRSEEVRPVLTPIRLDKRQNGCRFKENGEESFTFTSQDRHDVAEGVAPKYRIRKLTPKECFRLQAFSDEAHQALVDAGISDSQRYKMAGNAVTVNVIEAIGERLLPLISEQDETQTPARR